MRAWAVEICGVDGHQYPPLDVVIAESLAGRAYLPEEIPALEHFEFGPGQLFELALQVLDEAGGAPGVGAAAVEGGG